MTKKVEYITAVADFETDPFLHGRKPEPFSCGFYDGDEYIEFWGKDCAKEMMAYISKLKRPRRIYMHNGGKFDFFYIIEYLENPIRIINGRIVSAKFGKHELRDSYAIIPVPLKAYEKDDIAYWKFEARCREKYKSEILDYLKKDCLYLYDLVSAFVKRFGPKLTIGGTAISTLETMHDFPHGNQEHDQDFRQFYFGGRVEAFKIGRFKGKFKVYDVNSMYPHAMRNFDHPIGQQYIRTNNFKMSSNGEIKGFEGAPYFVTVEGHNYGAFPTRDKNGLDFNVPFGVFNVTSHEMRVALKHGLFKPTKLIEARIPQFYGRFKKYVDTFYAEKVASKEKGDKVNEIFAKLLLNSAYGKFAQDPTNYNDWLILPYGQWPDSDEWVLYESHELVSIFKKAVERFSYYDVCIAASITGAARAILLDAIASSEDVYYCDTDSIICGGRFGAFVDAGKLGAWKLEADLYSIAIAGKKLYAGRGVDTKGRPIEKIASKGIKATALQIEKMAGGATITWKSQAPNFKFDGSTKFVVRKARSKNCMKKVDAIKICVL